MLQETIVHYIPLQIALSIRWYSGLKRTDRTYTKRTMKKERFKLPNRYWLKHFLSESDIIYSQLITPSGVKIVVLNVLNV